MLTRLLKTAVAAVLLGIALGVARADKADETALKVGDTFPDLSTFKLEGKLPDDLKDKVILIDFWASWCEPCRRSFPVMDELGKRFASKGFVIVAVSVDEQAGDMEKFLKRMKPSFAVVRDASAKLVAKAGVPTMPTSFLVDRSGKIQYIHSGFQGDTTKRDYETEIEKLLK